MHAYFPFSQNFFCPMSTEEHWKNIIDSQCKVICWLGAGEYKLSRYVYSKAKCQYCKHFEKFVRLSIPNLDLNKKIRKAVVK